jgi:hypothetical protein
MHDNKCIPILEGHMKKEVLLYVTLPGIDEINNILEGLPISSELAIKIVKTFSSAGMKYSPRNDCGTVYCWKSIDWDCNRPEIMVIHDIIHSLEDKFFYLSIRDNVTHMGYTAGSALVLLSTMLRQNLVPFALYKNIGIKKEESSYE